MKKLITLFLLIFSISVYAQTDTVNLSIQVGAGSKFSPINVVDKITGNYIPVTITNLSIQNNSPELASIVVYNQTTIKATAVKSGQGIAIVSCHLDYTDAGDGLPKSEDKSIVISYNIIAASHGVRLQLSF